MVLDLQKAMKEVQASIEPNPFLFSLLFLFFLVLLVYRIFSRGPKLNLPPSPPKLPIIGNIHQLGKLPHRSLRTLAEKYGPVMLLRLGGNPTVVVSSAEAAREVMKTHDIVFASRPRTTATNIFFYGCVDVAFSPCGEYWKQAKKICVLELLSHKRVKSFQFIREEEAAVLIDKIRSSCIDGASINLTEMLMATSSNIICRSALGRKVEEEGGSRSKYGKLLRKFMTQLTEFSVGDMFRSLEWLDYFTGLIPQLKATATELDAFLDQIVEEHKNLGTGCDQFAKKDFVDILLHVQKSGIFDLPLTQDNIKAILLDVFAAGLETISTVIEWSMAELIMNPNIMKKAQEEVRRTVGKKSKVGMDDIEEMNYLKYVVKETLRLHPAAPLLAPRETSASVELGNYHIPTKTTVLVNAFAIHTDPKVWDRAEEFLPERFENKMLDVQGQDFHFIPFGGGRRRCPGETFALAAVTYLVANLLYWFDWKLPYDEAPKDLDMTEANGITVCKKVPLYLVPALYSC